MSSLLPYLVSELQEYGYPVLWLSVFIAATGFPLPMTLVLLAAGAFAALGNFNIGLLIVLTVSASVSGDSVGYCIGRFWGSRILRWLEHSGQRLISPRTLKRSRQLFLRRGGWAIFLSRFLFSAVGGGVTLLAGAELYPYRRFLLFDFTGEILGAVIPLGLGFIFGASWDVVGDILGRGSLFLLAALLLAWLSWRLLLLLRRMRIERVDNALEILSAGAAAGAPEDAAGSASGSANSLPL